MPDGGGRSDADADAVNAIQREREREQRGNFQFGLRSVGGGTTEKAKMEPKYAIGSDK